MRSIFLQGDPQKIEAGVLANLGAAGPRWISAGGCEMPDKTMQINLQGQSRVLRELN